MSPVDKQKQIETGIFYSILTLFVFYWASTLLYTSPNNYIKLQFRSYLAVFGDFFEQRWNFFAPPPTVNERLYYCFTHREDPNKILIFEALQPLLEQKRQKAPFNAQEDIVDYILSGSVININEALYNGTKTSRVQNPEKDDEFHLQKAREGLLQMSALISEYQTLKNYAQIIAARHSLDLRDYRVKMLITIKEIPKFKERRAPKETPEKLLLESPFFSFD